MLVSWLHELSILDPSSSTSPLHSKACSFPLGCMSPSCLILSPSCLAQMCTRVSAAHIKIGGNFWAGSGADEDLKAELNYVREECEAAQAKGRELQIKKNAAEARLVIHVPYVSAPPFSSG